MIVNNYFVFVSYFFRLLCVSVDIQSMVASCYIIILSYDKVELLKVLNFELAVWVHLYWGGGLL